MSERLSGGCLCGRVRFDAAQTPDRVLACHCTFCQKRTGSAFAAIAIYPVDAVTFTGELKSYEHASDESGQTITMHFCPDCSTTVTITLGRFPQIRTVPRGCFDNPNAIQISSHIWTRSAQTGVALPPGIECYAKGRVTLDGKRETPQVHAVPVMARDPASG